MASILKHLRSSTADKRPTASGLADGQIAINTASGTPAMFFKDSAGNVVKVGPAHVGTSAPNASPAGSAGNSTGELWVDNSLTTPGLNYYTGSAFVNLTPSGTTSTVGLVELATNAETQAGSDAVRAVTSAGLQSKLSDSTSTTSSTTIASSTAVKSAYDLANAALPKSGGTLTGELLISPSGSLVFEGSSDDSFETTIAVTNPTADRTITFPNVTGTVITTGDTGSVTSTMIANDTIVDADINASAAIAPSKLGSGALPSGVTVASANIVDGTIVNADVNASAAIAGTKISPDFGGQNVVTTGNVTGAALIPSSSTVPTNGVYLPSANNVAISTNGTGRLFVDASGSVGVGVGNPNDKLHVLESSASAAAATSASVAQFERAGNAAITVSTADSGAASIYFGDTASSTVGTIQYNHSDNSLLFGTNNAERLRITSDGKLGLGTSAPANLLHVQGDATFEQNAGGQFAIRGSTNTSNRLNFGFDTTSNYAWLQAITAGTAYRPIALNPAGGNVGIGTTAPAQALEVSASNARIRITDSDTTAATSTSYLEFYGSDARSAVVFTDSAGITVQADAAGGNAVRFNTNGSNERARIDSSGRLGLGTSSPGSLLHTTGSRDYTGSTPSYSSYDVNFQSGTASLAIGQSNGIPTIQGHGTGTSYNLALCPNAGRVGIGTTSPGLPLDVAGGIRSQSGTIDARLQAGYSGAVGIGAQSNDAVLFIQNATERARIDSSGRLLVGTSTSTAYGTATGIIQAVGTTNAHISLTRSTDDGGTPSFNFAKSRGTTASPTVVIAGDVLGDIKFAGYNGSNYDNVAARIKAEVDGAVTGGGANDMPGRIVLSTTLDGASSPTEALRITNDRVIAYNQPDVTSKSAAATLTVAELKTGIIQYTGAAATLTLPTGTLTEGGFNGIYTNMTFEWSVINTGSGTCTIGAGTGHTIVGSTTVAAGASGRFASRRTAANTFVTYRLS